jgi:hypothetical protein
MSHRVRADKKTIAASLLFVSFFLPVVSNGQSSRAAGNGKTPPASKPGECDAARAYGHV